MTYPQHDAEHDAGLAWNPDDLEALESLRTYRAPRDLGLPPRARQEPRDTRNELRTLEGRHRLLRAAITRLIPLTGDPHTANALRTALDEDQR